MSQIVEQGHLIRLTSLEHHIEWQERILEGLNQIEKIFERYIIDPDASRKLCGLKDWIKRELNEDKIDLSYLKKRAKASSCVDKKTIARLIIKSVKSGVTLMSALVYSTKIKEPSLSEARIRHVAWDLIDRGLIDLTWDRKLRIPKKKKNEKT